MEDQFTCPRCGFPQSPADVCSKCGINIPKYIELQKRRHVVPSREAQTRREEKPKRPESTEEPKRPSAGYQESRESSEQERPEPEPVMAEAIQTATGISGIGELFSRSWEVYKGRFWTLILLYILSIIFFVVVFGIFFGAGYFLGDLFADSKQIGIGIGAVIGGIAGFFVMCWCIGAFICAVADESLGIRDALEQGGQKVWSFLWLFTLLGFIITGGFLLLIIPGILFTVWFFSSQFILAREDEKGMNALLKSKEYVKDYWFDVFLRFLIIWVISAVLGAIPFIGPILSFAFMPFMMIFCNFIYEDLKAVKGDVTYNSSGGEKFKWIGVAVLGYIVLPVILIALMGAQLTGMLFFLKGMMQKDMPMMQEQWMPRSGAPLPELDGVWTGDEINGSGKWTFTISGGQIDVTGPQGEWYKGRIAVEQSIQPKHLDIEITAAPSDSYIGKTALGIYQMEGTILSMCGNEPGDPGRPNSFIPSGKVRCFIMTGGPSPPAGQTASPEGITPPMQMGKAPDAGGNPQDIMVYIYALNYKGMVRLNGEKLYEIKGEKDMNYNYSGSGDFRYGTNVIDVEYDSLPDSWKVELKIKVYRYDWNTKREEVLKEWVVNDKGGRKSLEIVINK